MIPCTRGNGFSSTGPLTEERTLGLMERKKQVRKSSILSYSFLGLIHPSYQTWGKDIEVDPPSVAYKEIMGSDKGVAKWTAQIVSNLHLFSLQTADL